MRTVFLSWHFGDSDRELMRQTEGLLDSHALRVVTGEDLGGGPLTTEIMKRIEQSDSLVALMTKRNDPSAYGGTHPWVVEEFKHAMGHQKRAIALVESGVTVAGAYKDHERIEFTREELLKGFLKLSRTIGNWKSEAGRLLKVQLRPSELTDQLAVGSGNKLCKYCVYASDGTSTDWRDAVALTEGDGTYAYLRGIKEESRIQVRVELAGIVWTSPVLQQWMPAELKHP
jgi:hypothetical protein